MIVAIAKKTELKIVVIDKKIVMTTEKMHGIVKTIDQTIAMIDKMDDQTIVKIVVTEENKQLFTFSINKNFILMKINFQSFSRFGFSNFVLLQNLFSPIGFCDS